MNKARLEWVVSGLNRYKLSEDEDRFVKSMEQEFDKKSKLTAQQETRIETLYKEKSKLMPDKHPPSSMKGVLQRKKRPRKFRLQNIY
jgi:hypothetical protein